ncbi:MAG: RNA methyltransferase [Bacteroidales bacterium]|nr:RNA methyltransferase [Bacteroidales bacterium]
MRTEFLSSGQNPKVKDLLALREKSSLRREKGLFVLEGRRELRYALDAGFRPAAVFFCPQAAGYGLEELLAALPADCRLYEVSAPVYEKMALRGGTEGVVALVRERRLGLSDLRLRENPLLVVLEGVEKPGNLGAVLRSADASGADAVLLCDPLTDLYNPNLIRASVGAVFTTQVAVATTAEAVDWLKARGIQILSAQLQDSAWYYDVDMTVGTAIVIGTEATGLTAPWRAAADRHVKIPMLGKADSLNASVSAAILLYEAVRQRQLIS